MLTDLAFESDLRGLFRFRYISGRMPYRAAAEQLLRFDGTVFLLTGFYVPDAHIIENDGLSGSWLLFHTLKSLGRNVIIPTDSCSYPVFKQIFPANTLVTYPDDYNGTYPDWAATTLECYFADTIIAIERPGPDSGGVFRNIKGVDISPFCAGIEHFWSSTAFKIAIGDGGNELGMGKLADMLDDGRPVCSIGADITLLGSTSDFATWCLVATLEIITGRQFLPDFQDLRQFLQRLSDIGIVDGITGKPDISIDSYPIDIIQKRYRKIQQATKHLKTATEIIDTAFEDDRKTQTVPIIHVDPGYNAENDTLYLDGYLLLDSQLEKLKYHFKESGLPTIESWPTILSRPDLDTCPWLYVPGWTRDLLEQPNGRRTSQITDTDHWVRRLFVAGPWRLYQTPDLAMGWSNDSDLAKLPETVPETNPWQSIIRAIPSACLDKELSISHLIEIAEELRGIPYLWGGRSIDGLDCSGMTQHIFLKLGIMLPRNSRVQRKCGCRIPLRDLSAGDLIFAVGKINNLHHVAIALPDGVQHACLTEKQVILESTANFQSRYRIIAIRRISSFA